MALLYSPWADADPLDLLLPFGVSHAPPAYASCRGMASWAVPPTTAAPWGWPATAAPPSGFFLRRAPLRRPLFPPAEELDVHVTRSDEGVLVAAPLGRSFGRNDIRLRLNGSAFTITVFHPDTEHLQERPVALRRTLELAPHVDGGRVEARLERGILSLLFPLRRAAPQPRPQPRVRLVLVQRGDAPAHSAAPAHVPVAVGVGGPSSCGHAPARVPVAAGVCGPSGCGPAPACVPVAAGLCGPSGCGPSDCGDACCGATGCSPSHCRAAGCCAAVPVPTPPPAPAASPVPPAPAASPAPPAHVTGLAAAPPLAVRRARRCQPHRQAEQRGASSSPPACGQRRRFSACGVAAGAGPSQAAPRSAPRTVPVEGPDEPQAAARPPAHTPDQPDETPAGAPEPATAPATEQPATEDPAGSSSSVAPETAEELHGTSSDGKGKAAASPEQVTARERQAAARAAAQRIAAGAASDSDWEDADGSVEDCPP